MMGSLSFWHVLIVGGVIALYVVPVALILRRMGYSPAWVLLWFIPVVNAIGLWIIATATVWPRERVPSSTARDS